jgi:hypothetical protein
MATVAIAAIARPRLAARGAMALAMTSGDPG